MNYNHHYHLSYHHHIIHTLSILIYLHKRSYTDYRWFEALKFHCIICIIQDYQNIYKLNNFRFIIQNKWNISRHIISINYLVVSNLSHNTNIRSCYKLSSLKYSIGVELAYLSLKNSKYYLHIY